MDRSTIQALLRSTRAGLARLGRLLFQSGGAEDAVFEPLRTRERRDRDDDGQRLADARKARTSR